MTFTHPWALGLLVLLPLPWLLTRLRRRTRVVVSSLSLWLAAEQLPAAQPSPRVRRAWLAALQSAVIGTLAFALAGPTMPFAPSSVALVFDLSASMGARAAGTARLDEARARAQQWLSGLPRRTRVVVISAEAEAREVGEFGLGDPSLARAIEALVTTDGTTDLDSAVRLARAGGVQVHVFTDLSAPDANSREGIVWNQVGGPADNLAVVRLAARRLSRAATECETLVGVRNYGGTARDVDVEIVQDGHGLGRTRMTIQGADERSALVRTACGSGAMSADLLADDAVEADNRRWTTASSDEPIRVGVLSTLSRALETALRVNPAVVMSPIPRDGAGRLPARGEAAWNDVDVVVCEACTEQALPLNALIVPPSSGGAAPALLSTSVPEHPLVAGIDVGQTWVHPVSGPSPANAEEAVLRAGGAPALIASTRDGRRTVTLLLDPKDPGVGLTTAFPVLIANAVTWLTESGETRQDFTSGEPLDLKLPRGVAPAAVRVTGPDGKTRHVQATGGRVQLADTSRAGVYRVEAGPWHRDVAVNPAVDAESDTGQQQQATLSVQDRPTTTGRQLALWQIAAGIALALFLVEWWVVAAVTPLRAAVAVLLLVCASGWAVWRSAAPVEVIAVVDQSASVPLRAQARAVSAIDRIGSNLATGDTLGVVTFGADAAVAARPSNRVRIPDVEPTIANTGTNIAGALRLARTMAPTDAVRRLMLISDGVETAGHAENEARLAALAGVRVDVLPPDVAGLRPPLSVLRVVAPQERRAHEPFTIGVELRGAPRATGELVVYRDDVELASQQVTADASGTASVPLVDSGEEPGVRTFRAVVHVNDADDISAGQGAGAVVVVSGPTNVLYVTTRGGPLPDVLTTAGFRVRNIAPTSLPSAAGTLAAFDSAILDDVAPEQLNDVQLSAIAGFVEQGGGLMVLGGARSLDRAGYPVGPLGRVLPIDLQPRAGRRAPGLNLVLVFDKSGSMSDRDGGVPRIELARRAVMQVLEVLAPTDALGVLAFDAKPTIVAPLDSARDSRALAARLQAIEPGGPTSIAPAIDLALQWLRDGRDSARARSKILLVTDGRTAPADSDEAMAAVARAGVEVSTVAIGDDADRLLLRRLAESSGGRAFFPDSVQDLPRIVSREAARSSGGAAVEETFTPRLVPHPLLAGLERATLPRLGGYVVGAAKPTSTAVLTSHLGDPILDVWRVGLGRVGVLTTDLRTPWGADLAQWSRFPTLWAQTVRWISRGTSSSGMDLDMRVRDGMLRISVGLDRTADGRAISLEHANAVVRLPSGETRTLRLAATGPATYEARTAVIATGQYVVAVSGESGENGVERRLVRGLYWSADQEHPYEQTSMSVLEAIARAGGGRVLGAADGPFDGPRPVVTSDIAPWLLAVALMLFVGEVARGRSAASGRRQVRGWPPRFNARVRATA